MQHHIVKSPANCWLFAKEQSARLASKNLAFSLVGAKIPWNFGSWERKFQVPNRNFASRTEMAWEWRGNEPTGLQYIPLNKTISILLDNLLTVFVALLQENIHVCIDVLVTF